MSYPPLIDLKNGFWPVVHLLYGISEWNFTDMLTMDQRLHIVTKDVISLSISVLLLFRHYISHKITFRGPSSGGVLCSACGAFIKPMVTWDVGPTRLVQIMNLGWPWPTLWQGQIWFLMHLYGENLKMFIFYNWAEFIIVQPTETMVY